MFKIGDTVVLVSGGPDMRVIGFSPSGRVWCQWECADGWVEEASFVPETLRQAS
jgi:uncharacterized protein YodC (DUF2158 family)